MAAEPEPMQNLATGPIQYKTIDTSLGTWKIFVYPSGMGYREFTSRASIAGWPLIHITLGKCPETGAAKTAAGIIAIGKKALGLLAIGQFAFGLITLAQFGIGFVFLTQFGIGWSGLGQVAIAYQLGIGQVATGITAIGQVAVGKYVLAQLGLGQHVVDMRGQDSEALQYFTSLWEWVKNILGIV